MAADQWNPIATSTVNGFENGWAPFSGSAGDAVPAFRVDGDDIRLKGQIKGGSLGTVIFTLPPEFRPWETRYYDATSQATQPNGALSLSVIEVRANGQVVARFGSPNRVLLDGIIIDTI